MNEANRDRRWRWGGSAAHGLLRACGIGLLVSVAACGGPEATPGWVGSSAGQAVLASSDGDAGDLQSRRPGRPCELERIIDGDTIVCAGDEHVRLLLIDTPERGQKPYGGLATEALRHLLGENPVVWLEPDVERVDRYGQTLAYLWLADGRMVNEEMARSGYAVSLTYPPNVKYVDEIRAAVTEAQEAGRGLWATEAFECTPREYRAREC